MDVVDVRITRVDYVEAITESVYRRMEAERKRVVTNCVHDWCAEGEKSRRCRPPARRDRGQCLPRHKTKGEGDAEAARIYADAFGRDPQFAQFYRSLGPKGQSIANKGDVMVLDPARPNFSGDAQWRWRR